MSGRCLEDQMKKRKVLLVATVVKIHVNVFHIPCLKMFQEQGWETWVCSRNDYDNPKECVKSVSFRTAITMLTSRLREIP